MSDTPAADSGERSSLLNPSGAEARRQAGVRSNERVRDVHDGATCLGADTQLAPRSHERGPRECPTSAADIRFTLQEELISGKKKVLLKAGAYH